MKPLPLSQRDFRAIYRRFSAPIARRFDCGRFCAPLNDGAPVCCSTGHAIPVARLAEWQLLSSRTKLWRRFKPYDAHTRKIVAELDSDCRAIACKGAAFCERDNRTLACRAFPFFPYFTKEADLAGITCYWGFEDRCWVASNLWIVEKAFIAELIAAYQYLFARDREEEEVFISHSAQMRRVFSRRGQAISLLDKSGRAFLIPPKSGGTLKPAHAKNFAVHNIFRSQKNYRYAVKAAGGDAKTAPLLPMPD